MEGGDVEDGGRKMEDGGWRIETDEALTPALSQGARGKKGEPGA
jgi:hypothetical protein